MLSPRQPLKPARPLFQSWDRLQQKGKFRAGQVEQFKSSLKLLPKPLFQKECDLFIEAIVEEAHLKEECFKKMDTYFEEKTIFASNTSSLSINALAAKLGPKRRERFLGLHFFNPAPLMKLVEVIPNKKTCSHLVEGLEQWFQSKGKKTARCADYPGFIVNRIARNYYGEPLRIVEQNDLPRIRETDRILKEVGGFPMGPFELMDLIGLDINYKATQTIWEAFDKAPRFAPHPLQKEKIDAGQLGRKTKGGFYPSK